MAPALPNISPTHLIAWPHLEKAPFVISWLRIICNLTELKAIVHKVNWAEEKQDPHTHKQVEKICIPVHALVFKVDTKETWRKILQQFLIQILQGAETYHNMLEQHLGK